MELASFLDHTLLKPNCSFEEVENLCKEALEYQFASVCIHPCYVETCAKILKGSCVAVCTTIGFPLGANTKTTKVFEAKEALLNGATELDMVMNLTAFFSGEYDLVLEEISEIKRHCEANILKVIIETCLLTQEQIEKACQIVCKASADFVKTSTGFSKSGAHVEDVKLMKQIVGERCQVKASGGIKTKEDALTMIEAGATRIGTSSAVQIASLQKKLV